MEARLLKEVRHQQGLNRACALEVLEGLKRETVLLESFRSPKL